MLIMRPASKTNNRSLLQYVRIYSGLGTCEEGTKMTIISLKECCNMQVETISPPEIASGGWQETTALLIIGGGYDRGYVHALGHAGITRIQSYVRSGGRYLGLCAGAYFGCGKIIFDEGGPLEVIGSQRLDFFSGACIGPVIPGFKYTDQSGACAIAVNWWFSTELHEPSRSQKVHPTERLSSVNTDECNNGDQPSGMCTDIYNEDDNRSQREQLNSGTCSNEAPQPIMCYLNGGGYFKADQQNDKNTANRFDILAAYQDQAGSPIAAVKCYVGEGMAILSALHMEYVADKMDATDPHLQKILPTLEANNRRRQLCFERIIAMLLH